LLPRRRKVAKKNEFENLSLVAAMYAQHLKTYRPRMYRALRRSGQLEKVAEDVARSAVETAERLVRQGMHPHEAWWEAEREYILVPSEKDLPNL